MTNPNISLQKTAPQVNIQLLSVFRKVSLKQHDLLEEQLRAAFYRGLVLQPGSDLKGLTLGRHDRWDSLGHMSLISAIEEAFSLSLPSESLMAIVDYDSALAIVKGAINTRSPEPTPPPADVRTSF